MSHTQPPHVSDPHAARAVSSPASLPSPPPQDDWERAHAAPTTRSGRARRGFARRWKLLVGLCIVLTFYVVAACANFIAPYDASEQSKREPLAPPTVVRFTDAEGRRHARPFIYKLRLTDPLARTYSEDTSARYPLALFTRGSSYKLFGLFTTDRHLFGIAPDVRTESAPAARADMSVQRVYLLGTDEFGRDRLSRLLLASRFSLAVGPLGTLFAGVLGVLLGCISGYAGRRTDALLMRAADAMLALPALVLILAARAAFPAELPPTHAGLLLVSIFVAIGWAEMARLARGLVLGLREREFVLAAVSLGLTETRILFRHILPNAARPLIVQLSLMLPAFLLAETALSFLGVGVQEPAASWGNMLKSANELSLLARQPFLLLAPAFAIFLFVLGVRLISDGLKRDANDLRAR